jgi:NADH dehydrogenase
LTSQQRFAQLSRYLPVLPVFGKGDTRFQPVYAGDIGRLVDILTRDNVIPITDCKGKIIEAVGPEGEFSHSAQVERPCHDPHSVLTFRQMMEIVVNYTGRFRPIVALPWVVGELQAEVMQLLPQNIFTITRDQVCSRNLN